MLIYLLKSPEATDREGTSRILPHEKISPLKDKKFIRFMGLSILYALCFYQLYSTIPVYYKDVYRMSESYIGILMGLNGLIIVLIEMVLIFHLESQNKTLHHDFKWTAAYCSFLSGIYFSS